MHMQIIPQCSALVWFFNNVVAINCIRTKQKEQHVHNFYQGELLEMVSNSHTLFLNPPHGTEGRMF